MRNGNLSLIMVVLITLSPAVVFGHPGHGTFDGINIFHYLTSPMHYIVSMTIIAVGIVGVRYIRKRRRQVN